jgi:hypothetical protein
MPNSNNNNNDPVNAGNGAVEYAYSNAGNNESFTQEELEAIAREIAESNRALANRERTAALRNLRLRRAGRTLGRLPGRASWIARAKGKVNTRRRAAARANEIKRKWQTARRQYKQNINNAANLQYESNEDLNSRNRASNWMEGNDYEMEKLTIQSLRNAKANFKRQAVNQLRQTLRNSAAAENARIYANTKTVLLSEPKNHRQTVLKVAALDDLMVNEREKLALASTNAEAMEAATRLYNIEQLKEELDQARHETKLPTVEQNARYAGLVAGKNFSAMATSLYRRLVNNNAAKTAAEVAEAARAAEEAAALVAMPMVPINALAAPAPAAPARASANNVARARAARLARFKGGKRTRRNQKN